MRRARASAFARGGRARGKGALSLSFSFSFSSSLARLARAGAELCVRAALVCRLQMRGSRESARGRVCIAARILKNYEFLLCAERSGGRGARRAVEDLSTRDADDADADADEAPSRDALSAETKEAPRSAPARSLIRITSPPTDHARASDDPSSPQLAQR